MIYQLSWWRFIFRLNAIKDENGIWREFPTGNKVDFHHFPDFDPSYGKPGDTLTWHPPHHLRVSDSKKHYPPLYYYPKDDVCQRCPDFDKFDQECNNAGDCWRGFCVCDNGFSGFKCQDAR